MHEYKKSGSVVVNELKSEVEIMVHLPNENGIKGIILDATKKSIKLQSSSYAFSIEFTTYQLKDSDISAKWLKNKKKLRIKCPKTNN